MDVHSLQRCKPFDLQVPDNYTCSICRDPPLGRQSALYSIHHEWIRWNSCLIISFALMSSHVLGREACPALPQVHPKMLPWNSCPGTCATFRRSTSFLTLETSIHRDYISSLMADLCALSSVLHSLQVKLAVAAQKNNPKVNLQKHDLFLQIHRNAWPPCLQLMLESQC